jgi:hypothetical protein
MLSGRRQAFGHYPVEEQDAGNYRPELPMMFEEIRSQDGLGEDQVVLVGNTEFLIPIAHSLYAEGGGGARFDLVTDPTDPTGETPGPDDKLVTTSVLDTLAQDHPRLLAFNFHQVDRSGHYGEVEDYPADVTVIDGEIIKIWDAIQDDKEYRDNTWMVITADHGRHHVSGSSDPPWRNHGDSCNGCRLVPLMIVGPNVKAGQRITSPVLLEDVAATVASLLGNELPWSEGIPADGLFDLDLSGGPSGTADLVLAGDHEVGVRYVDDPLHRKEVRLDGETISSAAAIVAEAPAVASGFGHAMACFREIVADPAADPIPWVGRCVYSTDDGATWADAGWPEATVGPYWQPHLRMYEQGVLAVWPDNPNAIVAPGNEGGEVGMQAAFWNGETWAITSASEELLFPLGANVIQYNDLSLVAIAAGEGKDTARWSRRIHIGPVSIEFGRPVFGPLVTVAFDEFQTGSDWRIERPALYWNPDDGSVRVAFVGLSDDYPLIGVGRSTNGGLTWQAESVLQAPGRVMGHLTPAWLHGQVVFGVTTAAGMAQVCKADPVTAVSACVDVGSARIGALSVDGDSVWVTVDRDVGDWDLVQVPEGDFP